MGHHAPATLIEIAKSGATLQVGPGYTCATYVEIAKIAVEVGSHVVLDLSSCSCDTVRQVAAAGGRNITIKL